MKIGFETAPPGEAWYEAEWPGCLMRTARLDAAGSVIPGSERFHRIPQTRSLEDAMAWAAQEFLDPERPKTREIPQHLWLSALRKRSA